MVEPEKQDDANNLEDTVRNLREENAQLLQMLRSKGFLLDPSAIADENTNGNANITFQNSDVSLTSNTINTSNQVTHQHVNNHGPVNQQNYSGQVVHGHQSNIAPNFSTVIQTASQPFVQNNSNTLVQNNTNLIQPINLVNFNNVSLDSIQSFFASQSNLLYVPPTSSSSSTTTTTTTSISNITANESEPQHQVSIRPKPSFPETLAQDSSSTLPKLKPESYENVSRQLSSSSNTETSNLLDNDLNHKQPRPIRPKPSSRHNSLQVYNSVVMNETKPTITNVLTPSSLINHNHTSSTVSLLSPSTSFDEHPSDSSPQLSQLKSMDVSISATTTIVPPTKKPTKQRIRPRKPTSTTSVSTPTIVQTPIPIAPNLGRPLAPAPLNVQRVVTSTKRPTGNKKRSSKTLMSYHSESGLQLHSPPTDSFAESISGLMQNFDQELMAANFLSQPAPLPTPASTSSATVQGTTTTTTNILSAESSHPSLIRTLDSINVRQIVNTTMQQADSYSSMPSYNDFTDRLENEQLMSNQTMQDYHVDNEQITSLINEEEMRFVEMNFDENTFLKQFDLEDAGMKLNINADQNLFTNLLTSNHSLEQSTPPAPPPPHPVYPGSSLINNNVFTTVVPLAQQQQQSSQSNAFHNNHYQPQASRFLPEEGVQLTARHIEPSQVATFETGKYQDILDELVTVSDQDVLTHAQATAANDTTVIATDFSFALLEATHDIIKGNEIEAAEETASAFVDLQYFYPIEQAEEEEDDDEEEFLDDPMEQCPEPESHVSPVAQEKFENDLIASTESPKAEVDAPITDLSSILQIGQSQSPLPSPARSPPPSPPEEVTRTIDYDSLLPPPSPPPPPPPALLLPPPPAPSIPVAAAAEIPNVFESASSTARPARIIFEPILSPLNSPSPIKPSAADEMILDSGCLENSLSDKCDPLNNDQIEELLGGTTKDPYDILDQHDNASVQKPVPADDLDDLIEPMEEPTEKVLEKNYYHYQKVYQDTLKKTPEEQYSPIPCVKLKLNSIYPKEKKERPPSPVLVCEAVRPPLKIKIRTKLPMPSSPKKAPLRSPSPPPPPPPPSEPLVPKLKIRKPIKKQKRKKAPSNIDDELEREAKRSLKTEYAGLTRFEQKLAERYNQQASSHLHLSGMPSENDDSSFLPNLMIKQDTPPTAESKIHVTSPPVHPPPHLPLPPPAHHPTKKYSHLFNGHHEASANNMFITPPPDTDSNVQPHAGDSHDYHPKPKKVKKHNASSSFNKECYPAARKSHHEPQLLLPPPPLPPPPPPPSQAAAMHMDPYAQSYHHFNSRNSSFFHFPFANPYINPHPPSAPAHYHPHSVKYHHPTHAYPPHQPQFNYHPHAQRQPHYHNANYMPSRDRHPFNR